MHEESTYFVRVREQTPTKFWINNVTREEAHLALDHGALGCTQNPSYTWKMLCNEQNRAHVLEIMDALIAREKDDDVVMSELQITLIEEIAEIFLPLYEASKGRCGYVTVQENPFLEEADFIVERAHRNRKNYPNIMIKIPVVEEGLKAISTLVAEGVPINATEVMAIQQAVDVCKAYADAAAGLEKPPVSVYSHIAGIFDEYIRNTVAEQGIDIPSDYVWQAGIAAAKKIYQMTKTYWPEMGFVSGGARGLHHFTEMVGADCMVTINWVGTARELTEQNPPVVQRFLQPVPHEVIDTLCAKIPDFRRAYEIGGLTSEEYEDFGPVVLFRSSFEKSWVKATEYIRARRAELGL